MSRARISSRARRTALFAPVLLVLACSGGPGVATGTTVLPLTAASPSASPATQLEQVAETPRPPATVVVFVTAPAHRGERATLTATTAPHAECTAMVAYTDTPVRASALGRRESSAAGEVSWTWTVAARVPSGEWPLTVSCTPGGEAATILTVA